MQKILSNQLNLIEQIKEIKTRMFYFSLNPNEINKPTESEKEAGGSSPTQLAQQPAVYEEELDNLFKRKQALFQNLNKVNKSDIAEIKAFKYPPSMLNMVSFAVCICFSKKPSFESFKSLLSDPYFLRNIQNYDLNSVSDYVYKELDKYVTNPDYTINNIYKVSRAGSVLCEWTLILHESKRISQLIKRQQRANKYENENLDQLGLIKSVIVKNAFSFYWPCYYGNNNAFLNDAQNQTAFSEINQVCEKIEFSKEQILSIDDNIKVFNEKASLGLSENSKVDFYNLAEKYAKSKAANVINFII